MAQGKSCSNSQITKIEINYGYDKNNTTQKEENAISRTEKDR